MTLRRIVLKLLLVLKLVLYPYVRTFAHKLRLTEYFHDHDVTPIDKKKIESLGKSMFYPPTKEIRNLRHICTY